MESNKFSTFKIGKCKLVFGCYYFQSPMFKAKSPINITRG